MLDVLDLDALRAPDEDRVGVRRVHDVGDLEPELAGLGDVLVRRVDLDRQVVQERLLRISRLALVKLDERTAGLDTGRAGGALSSALEAEALVLVSGLLGRARPESDVFQVVLDLGRRLDEAQTQALGDVEVHLAHARPLDLRAVELGERAVEARDPQRDVLERPLLAGPLGREQRQLPAPGVGADQGEGVGPFDHVHADAGGDEVGYAVAVGDPERDVIERLRRHGRSIATGL